MQRGVIPCKHGACARRLVVPDETTDIEYKKRSEVANFVDDKIGERETYAATASAKEVDHRFNLRDELVKTSCCGLLFLCIPCIDTSRIHAVESRDCTNQYPAQCLDVHPFGIILIASLDPYFCYVKNLRWGDIIDAYEGAKESNVQNRVP